MGDINFSDPKSIYSDEIVLAEVVGINDGTYKRIPKGFMALEDVKYLPTQDITAHVEQLYSTGLISEEDANLTLKLVGKYVQSQDVYDEAFLKFADANANTTGDMLSSIIRQQYSEKCGLVKGFIAPRGNYSLRKEYIKMMPEMTLDTLDKIISQTHN